MQTNKNKLVVLPAQTIGIIGGGQLGRMMALSARHMGYKIAVLDPTPDCPTAQIADIHIEAAYDDMDGIKRLTEVSDVITYEFENVDLKAATYIEEQGKLPQGAYALEITQNRKREKQLIKDLGLPVPDFAIVESGKEAEEALSTFILPAVIKTCRGGYDGKGQVKIESAQDFKEAIELAEKQHPCIIEQWIPFDKEISAVFTRAQNGDIEFFPIAENDHRDHILYQTTVPANVSGQVIERAKTAAGLLADEMNIVGTFAVEMFVKGEDIYLNEMAPRPHNSGHYTIEACNISQFAQHVRAICGLPLMPVRLLGETVMINILGEDMPGVLKAIPVSLDAFIHLYGKDEPKEKRKMGHVTFLAETKQDLSRMITDYEKAKQ